MGEGSTKRVRVTRIKDNDSTAVTDALAVEEPLGIRLEYGSATNRKIENISVTMRTPGHDAELAAGFLFTEGIVKDQGDIAAVGHCFIACAENKENVIQVSLKEDVTPNLQNAGRNFYTTSSCGVCGKGSIDAIRTVSSFTQNTGEEISIPMEILYQLPDKLRQRQ